MINNGNVNEFEKIVSNRRAIRIYDPSKKISQQELLGMFNLALRTPTSCNLQPTRFKVIDTAEGKEKLKGAIWPEGGKNQFNTCSSLILVYADTYSEKNADKIYNTAVANGWMPKEIAINNLKDIHKQYDQGDFGGDRRQIAVQDAAAVANVFMLIASSRGYGTCPIGAFDREEALKIFDIDTKRYASVFLISIGVPDGDKGFVTYRMPAEEVTNFE